MRSWTPPEDVDEFALDVVLLEGRPMTLTGHELELAASALSERGRSYAEIAELCRSDETTVRRVLNTIRARVARAARRQDAA